MEKLKGEEAEFSKTLFVTPLETVAFKRFWVNSSYHYPVTIEVFGINGELLGMNVKVYDPATPHADSNGQFLVILNSLATGELINLKSRTTYRLEEYRKLHGIVTVLDKKGFDVVFNRAMNRTGKGVPSVQRPMHSPDFKYQISCLETFFALNEMLS